MSITGHIWRQHVLDRFWQLSRLEGGVTVLLGLEVIKDNLWRRERQKDARQSLTSSKSLDASMRHVSQ